MIFRKKKPEISIIDCESIIYFTTCLNNRQVAKIICVPNDDNELLICDITHNNERDYSKGYGTMMMEGLIKYAKEHEIKHIYGNLSTVDADHKERLHHFYEKFGFTITEFQVNKNNFYGRIDLDLQ